MHNHLSYIYTFIENEDELKSFNLQNNSSIILRNYKKKFKIKSIIEIKKFCKKKKIKIYLSNDIKMALQASLDGAYIPSFNKSLNLNNFNNKFYKKGFKIIGSAHSLLEVKYKEKQGINLIFLSPLFLTKNYQSSLNVVKFNLIAIKTNSRLIALGGISQKNINKISMLKIVGFSGISYFK